MMRTALKKLGCVREETAIIGDRMDTDILAGVEIGNGYGSGAFRRDITGRNRHLCLQAENCYQ